MNLEFLKSPAGADPIVIERQFTTSPERLFRAWTQPEEIVRWFGPAPHSLATAAVDLRVGGIWRLDFPTDADRSNALTGEYEEIVPGRRLVYSWRHEQTGENGDLDVSPVSTVTVKFTPADNGTLLIIEHAGGSEEGRKGFPVGWTACLENLYGIVDRKTAGDGR